VTGTLTSSGLATLASATVTGALSAGATTITGATGITGATTITGDLDVKKSDGTSVMSVDSASTSMVGFGTDSPRAVVDARYGTGTPAGPWVAGAFGPKGDNGKHVVLGTSFDVPTIGGHGRGTGAAWTSWENLAINPSGGNVGIGTFAPSSTLHVVGDATIAGAVTVTGAITQSGKAYAYGTRDNTIQVLTGYPGASLSWPTTSVVNGGFTKSGNSYTPPVTGLYRVSATASAYVSHTLVPIRPRRRGERRSLRTLPGASLRPPLAFNPRHRRLQLQLTPLNSTPTSRCMERPSGTLPRPAASVRSNSRCTP
jgi:hypothetical protein